MYCNMYMGLVIQFSRWNKRYINYFSCRISCSYLFFRVIEIIIGIVVDLNMLIFIVWCIGISGDEFQLLCLIGNYW